MVKLSASLTLWVLLPVPVVALAVRYFGETIHRLSEQIQAALGTLSTRAQENLTGIRVIRAYAQEKPEIAAFDLANRDYVNRNIKLIATWSLFFPFLTALIGITFVILLGKGGRDVIDHRVHGRHDVGVLLVPGPAGVSDDRAGLGDEYFSARRGLDGAAELHSARRSRGFGDAAGGSERTRRIGASERAATGDCGERLPAAESAIQGEIEFRHLTFTYPTARNEDGTGGGPVLHDINLHVPAGSTLAIVGPTGSGKSTLAALIARLWEAPPGTLFLDGRSIRDYPLAEVRRAIGYVPQDTFLFSDTLRENIAFGVNDRGGRTHFRSGGNRQHFRRNSELSAAATTRWWASAASRFPAGRSSGRLLRARCCASRKF